ncbi:hypothetical protein SDC9_66310 [bioreactor metagenome]|uniref:Uncharacterized protein n=1 Tax=bioreactor metagenome TaxID=1076179 RepID=A0A644Y029_9ZZZZ
MLAVGLRVARLLHGLRHRGDVGRLPAVDLDQCRVERIGGVVRVEDLRLGPPALGGALLEQADGVPVAVVQIADPRLLVGRRHGDRPGPGRQPLRHGPTDDDPGVVGLLQVQHGRVAGGVEAAAGLERRGLDVLVRPQPDDAADQRDRRQQRHDARGQTAPTAGPPGTGPASAGPVGRLGQVVGRPMAAGRLTPGRLTRRLAGTGW